MANDWFEHPKYVRTRERLIKSLTSSNYRFRKSESVVFLCGGEKSMPRDELAAYLRKNAPDVRLFYAEAVWELIASRLKLGALKMESDLASLADVVIIIVESAGTIAELGAFSNNDALRKKLLPIVDLAYRPPQKSFLALGPLQWIESESTFSPPIYVPLKGILAGIGEIEERISRIPRMPTRISNLADSSKHLLLFICDLVAIIQPATFDIVQRYCKRILPAAPSHEDVATLMALAKALNLLQLSAIDGVDYFLPSTSEAVDKPFHHVRLTGLPALRAEHVAALLNIPSAQSVLDELRRIR